MQVLNCRTEHVKAKDYAEARGANNIPKGTPIKEKNNP